MYLTDVSMQLVSMLFVLIIGLYFFMLVFSFYRREKRRTREQDVRRYTYEYCFIYFYNFIDSDFKFSSESSKRLD